MLLAPSLCIFIDITNGSKAKRYKRDDIGHPCLAAFSASRESAATGQDVDLLSQITYRRSRILSVELLFFIKPTWA